MLKHFDQIVPRPTSHSVRLKRVLLSGDEMESAVIQIAVTKLAAGEIATEHRHASMEESFYFMKGEEVVKLDGRELLCREGDFLQVECGRSHYVRAKSEVEMLTVGVAV